MPPFDYSKTYFKIIGNNHKTSKNKYIHYYGLVDLQDYEESFDSSHSCTSNALYFSDKDHISDYIGIFGDTLCTIKIPFDALVIDLFGKYKTNKMLILRHYPLNNLNTYRELQIELPNKYNAALYGYLDIVKYHLKYEQNEKNKEIDNFILSHAIQGGQLKVIEYLNNKGYIFTDYDMQYAASKGQLHVMKYLFNRGIPYTEIIMLSAITGGYYDIVKYLHKHGISYTQLMLKIAKMCKYSNIIEIIERDI